MPERASDSRSQVKRAGGGSFHKEGGYHKSYSLNSLRGGSIVATIQVTKGDTRSLD